MSDDESKLVTALKVAAVLAFAAVAGLPAVAMMYEPLACAMGAAQTWCPTK